MRALEIVIRSVPTRLESTFVHVPGRHILKKTLARANPQVSMGRDGQLKYQILGSLELFLDILEFFK